MNEAGIETPKSEKKTRGPKKGSSPKTRPAITALPFSSGVKEVQVEILAAAMAALEKEAEAQSRGKRFGKIEVSDVVTALVFDMGPGPAINKRREEKKTTSLTVPSAALALLEAAAEKNGVTVDRIIQELALSLQG